MEHTEIFEGPGDHGVCAVGVGKSPLAIVSKLNLISGKELLENCNNGIQMKETQIFPVLDAVPETEQRDWKKRKKKYLNDLVLFL